MTNILNNLAANYPQAPVSGGTHRMREAITLVDRSDDDQNDFIFANGIKISDHLHIKKFKNRKGLDCEAVELDENGDYTEFIMLVINKAVQVAQNTKADKQGRTIFELFSHFSEHLFWISQQKEYQKIIESVDKN